MNIQDAIKSNKPFKMDYWAFHVEVVGNYFISTDTRAKITISALDISSDRWELKQEPRKVTLYQYLYEYSGKKILMSLETNETWDQYNCDRDDCNLLKTFTREIEY